MIALIRFAFSHTRTVLVVLCLAILAGISTYITIPKESTPDIKIPIIYVNVIFEGISPQDGQRLLIKPIEQEIRSLEGIKEIKAISFEGGASVIVEFQAGYNTEKARNDVRDKVDIAKANFPNGTHEPTLTELNLSQFPILIIKLSGESTDRTLFRLARNLRDQIQANVSSVLKADLVGDRQDAVEIIVTPAQLEQYPLVLNQLSQHFASYNQIVPAGLLEQKEGAFSIKLSGLFETADDVANTPILSYQESVVRLKDLAEVRRTFKDPISLAHNRIELGKSTSTVVLEISKRAGENLIQTVANVKKIVEKEQASWPKHISVTYAQDESGHIHEMLNDLQNNIIAAIILVMLVIVGALGWRSALLVGIAVPGAFLMGILAIQFLGYTVNIVVLFSLIFSVGMLVDGAIIVVEYADQRMEQGVNTYDAYLEAATRMMWPVITSTLTILVVFLPLLFWPGVVGQFMKFMPITLIAVLTASILMALVFIPAIASIMNIGQNANTTTFHSFFVPLTNWYIQKLNWALDRPKKVITGALTLLIVVKLIHSIFGRGVEFFPDVEPDFVSVHVHGRGNLSIHEKEKLVSQVEHTVLDMKEFRSIYTRIGAQSKNSKEQYAQDVIGSIILEFEDWQNRPKAPEILKEVQRRIDSVPGVYAEIIKQKKGPADGKPLKIQISGINRSKIEETLKKLRTFIETLDGLTAIEDTLPIEWKVQIDRLQAAKFGANVASIGSTIKLVTTGLKVGAYRPDDVREEVDILVRLPESLRSLSQLQHMRMQTSQGLVPFSLFTTLTPQQKVPIIERVNGYEVLSLMADLKPNVLLADKISVINAWIQEQNFDKNVRIRFKGQDEDRKESGLFLAKAFGLAIFLVAIILITQFNSFFSMGLVLSAVIMSTIGVFIGLLVHNLAFGVVMGGIGVIALAGIIVSNNIILIDTFDALLAEMKERIATPSLSHIRHVIVETCAQRLRPVILTKLTTILGLLPIMFGVNIDFMNLSVTYGAPSTQWWILLSTCIVYGVLFASCLTLIVTPCALMWRAQRNHNKTPPVLPKP
jgi:multidrug efflux pump